MKFEIVSMKAENFMGLKPIDLKFGHKNTITGVNGAGKTRIMNLFYWLIKNTMADGRSPENIRTRDKDGNIIPRLVITGEIVVNIDGEEHTIKKTLKEKYTREGIYNGNEVKIEVDNFAYTLKKYEEWWAKYIDKDVFNYCSNPVYFFNKNAGEKRDLLTKMFGFDDDIFVAENPEYAKAGDIMKGHTVEETIKALKQKKKEKEKERDSIPARISETELMLSQVDNTDYTDRMAELQSQIKELDYKTVSSKNAIEELNNIASRLSELQIKKSNIFNDFNNINAEKTKHMEVKRVEIDKEISLKATDLSYLEEEVRRIKNSILEANDKKVKYANEWKKTKNMVFDEKQTICQMCGQTLPNVNEIKNQFVENKKTLLASIVKDGNAIVAHIKELEKTLEEKTDLIKKEKVELMALKDKLAEADSIIEKIKTTAPKIEEYEPYIKVEKEIETCKDELDSKTNITEQVEEAKDKKMELENQLFEIRLQTERSKSDKENFEKRISELKEEQLKATKSVSNINAMINLINDYSIKKNEALKNRINANFEGISFRFEKPLQNGEMEKCCILEIDGIAYEQTLNTGHRKTAEIALIRAFQKANDIIMPIFVDEYSVIDPWRIPNTEQQLILLGRGDSKEIEMVVE